MVQIKTISKRIHLFLTFVCVERGIGRCHWRSTQSGPGGHSTGEGVAPEEEADLTEVIPSKVQSAQPEGFTSEDYTGCTEQIAPDEDAGWLEVVWL